MLTLIILIISCVQCQTSDDKKASILHKSTVNQPMHLGMLYDARTDTVVPGLTLWNNNVIQRSTTTVSHKYSKYNIETLETVQERLFYLNVDASIFLSIFAGKVLLQGSAKVIVDNRKSDHSYSVNLGYFARTEHKSMNMELLKPAGLQHPRVIEMDLATHVIVGVTYGADAIFTYTSADMSDKELLSVDAKFRFKLEKSETWSLDLTGFAKVDMSDAKDVQRLQVDFKGDFVLVKNPENFETSMELYRNLPKLIADKRNSIPKEVWLLPLHSLNDKVLKLMGDISDDLTQQTITMLDAINLIKRNLVRLQQLDSVVTFPILSLKLLKFERTINAYWGILSQRVGTILPTIRATGSGESELAQVLINYNKGIFAPSTANQYLNSVEAEAKVLQVYNSNFASVKGLSVAFHPGVFVRLISDIQYDKIVAFKLNIFNRPKDEYLRFAEYFTFSNLINNTVVGDIINKQLVWYQDRNLTGRIVQLGRQFYKTAQANLKNIGVKFVVGSIPSSREHIEPNSVELLLLEDVVQSDFHFISQPKLITVVKLNDSYVQASWEAPKTEMNHIQNYWLRAKNIDDPHANWIDLGRTDDKSQRSLVAEVQKGTKYKVVVAAMSTDNIFGLQSDHISLP